VLKLKKNISGAKRLTSLYRDFSLQAASATQQFMSAAGSPFSGKLPQLETDHLNSLPLSGEVKREALSLSFL